MIDINDLRFRYPAAYRDSLAGIDLHLESGSCTLIAGQSGSGKSTLLRCLNGLIPHFHGGFFSGNVIVDGRNTRQTMPRDLATSAGTVFQDPESQLVTDTAADELAFTLENLGWERRCIPARINRICEELGIEHLRTRRISTLSGGERQLIALAAALAPEPRALLLDEPTSQLDPSNAQRVIETLARLSSRRDLALVIAEHRLERLLNQADSILLASEGRVSQFSPAEARRPLSAAGLLPRDDDSVGRHRSPSRGEELLRVRDLSFSYGRSDNAVFTNIDLTIHEGETVALTGPNGAGKTTLLKQLIGILRPKSGSIVIMGERLNDRPVQQIARTVGYVPQQATLMLHQETVEDELQFTLDALNRSASIQDELAGLELDGFEHRHPLDLSGGERQRLAIAAISIAEPRLLLLDEPTRGLPWSMKRDLAATLRARAATGCAVIVATHDEDFVRAFASRHITLSNGSISLDTGCDLDAETIPAHKLDQNPLLTASNLD